MGYKALIADSNREHMRMFRNYIDQLEIIDDYELAFNGKDAVRIAAEYQPDLVLCSIILQDYDGFEVAYKLRHILPSSAIAMTTSVESEFATQSTFSNGADVLIIKPCDFRIFERCVRALMKNRMSCQGSVVRPESREKKIIMDITREIQHIGISAGIKGFKYARMAIYLYMQKDHNVSVMKDIYPVVAKKFNTNAACVERNIRHAVESAWTRGSISYIDEVFGLTVDADKGKPTNSAFIATLAERVKIRNMI